MKNLKDKIYESRILKLVPKYLFLNLPYARHKVIIESRAFIFLSLEKKIGMNIKIALIGIESQYIKFFKEMVVIALEKPFTDTDISMMLIRLGILDGWPQLRKLKEMETVVRSPGFDQKQNQDLLESLLYLALEVQNKIIIERWLSI